MSIPYTWLYEDSKTRVVLGDHLSSVIKWRDKEELARMRLDGNYNLVAPQEEYKQEIDLYKGGEIHKGKLVRRMISVKGKEGKIFYHMQWVDPSVDSLRIQHEHKEEDTYAHHENRLKEMEHRQNNKFPVVRVSIGQVRVDSFGYMPDIVAISDAIGKYDGGEKLPPVRITIDGKILRNHVMYEMAKRLGLSHIPTIILGNTDLKKKLEIKYKEKTLIEAEDEYGNKVFIPIGRAGSGVDFKPEQIE